MTKKILVLGGFFVLAALWFWKELFLNYLFCFSDLTFYFYPYRNFMVESVHRSVIPLWNPYVQLGFPFFATLQTSLFYPFSLLYYLLPFDRAFSWFLIVHFPLAAFFMYLLAREFKQSQAASFASGLTFAFSGYLLSVLHMPTTLEAVTWLPLVMLFWNRMIKSEFPNVRISEQGILINKYIVRIFGFRISDFIALALLLALMFLGGEPTILYGTGWLLLGYLVYIKYGRWRELGQGILALASAFVLAGLLTAVQLLPFIELLFHSSRQAGISFKEAAGFSLRPRELLELVFPYLFVLSKFPWVSMSWVKLPYLGVVPAGLALFGLGLDRSRLTRWLAWTLVFLFLIVLGSRSPLPVYYLLYKLVPGFNLLRYPAKFLFLIVFLLSLLTGRGIDRLSAEPARLKKIISGLSAGLILAAALYLLLSSFPGLTFKLFAPLLAEAAKDKLADCVRLVTVPRDVANLGILAGFLALFTGWLALYYKKALGRGLFAAGLAALVFLDLYTASAGISLSVKAETYRQAPPANVRIMLADKSLFRFLVSPDIFLRSHFELGGEFQDYGLALQYLRDRLTADQGMLYHLSDANGYESIIGADGDKLFKKIWGLDSLAGVRILDLINVKYLVTGGPFPQRGYRLLTRKRDPMKGGEILLYRNTNVLPRGFFVPVAVVVPSREAALDAVFRPGFDPRRAVVLEEKVNSPGGFWFTSEWFYPGWRAFVDGKEAPIYRADYMFRAVPVPPGFHEVRFVYDPPLFRLGTIISLVTLFGVIMAFSAIIVYNKIR
jgi:Bacterial membrane protein YfhO